jgi:alkanesulfonate monooxygenase SsuD/methylene tetrahydromethanopterin reductase-like flavin-dependent oxidoreductase (luciferase family)
VSVTFGLGGLPSDAWTFDSGSAYLDGYARCTDVMGPEFTTLWVSDHLQWDDFPALEAWTRMCVLAARFDRFKVGSLVLAQGYRNPALLAKMAASLQFLTDGRLVLGIGAGWKEDEYLAFGYRYPSRKERVDELTEALTILRLMWQGGPVTFRGEHYSIENAYCYPVPDPPIPILIGTGGTRVLRLAAEHADGWNWDALESLYELRDKLNRGLDAFCRSSDDVMVSANVIVNFPENADGFVAIEKTSYPEYDNDQTIFGPTPEAAIDGLRPFVEAGVTHFQVSPADLRTLQLFAAEVAPVLAT